MLPKRSQKPTLVLIKENAKILFLEQGYSNTSIRDICDMTKITKGSLFHYYQTKEELAKDVITSFFDGFSSLLESNLQEFDNDQITIINYVDALIAITHDIFLSKGCLIGSFIQEVWISNPDLMDLLRKSILTWENSIIQILEIQLQGEKFSKEKIAQIAKFLIATYEGGMILSKTYGDWNIIANMLLEYRNYLVAIFG